MRFLYFYRVPVPDPRADAIQIINTCAGISRAGGDVSLHAETIASRSTAECLDYYGIKMPTGEGAGRLDLAAMGSHWSWPLFNWKTKRILKGAAGSPACLFVREVRPYVPGLIARAKAAGLRVIFEAHNLSAALVREKQWKAEGGGGEHGSGAEHGGPGENAVPLPSPPDEPSAARQLRRKAARRSRLEEMIVRETDGLICTQRATLEGLRHLLKPGAPATVLGNGTQIPEAQEGAPKQIDILYCGSLKQWKGVDTLVAAMQTLYPYRLTIVGPTIKEDVDRLRQTALAVGVFERLRILPAVRPADVWDLYAQAKVGVVPLPGEAFVEARDFTSPLKLFEMMAAGLPIVCSRLKSLQEYVSDGREALMVTADDPRPLAEGLRRLLADEALRSSLAAAAKARVTEYTWDSRGRKVLAFAEELFR